MSIEQDQKHIKDEKQSLGKHNLLMTKVILILLIISCLLWNFADYWKPEDLPFEEASDSSDTSSSLVTNLSIEKMQTLSNEVEVTDSSDDEYIPQGKNS